MSADDTTRIDALSNLLAQNWWAVALRGVIGVLFGLLLVIAPLIGAIVLTWWMGAYAMVFGISMLVLAFKLRQKRDERQGYARAV